VNLAELISLKQYSLRQELKNELLGQGLNELHEFHLAKSLGYQKVFEKLSLNLSSKDPFSNFLPVSLFKEFELYSVAKEEIHKTLTSSGTSGQQVSKIFLDTHTATMQTKALNSIMSHVLGNLRLPMLIIDTPSVIKDRTKFSARGAGIMGMMTFGRDHTYALNDDLTVNLDKVRDFLDKYKGKPKLLFGFTFVVWTSLIESAGVENLDFEGSILVHSGGWKKLVEKSVSNEVFKADIKQRFRISEIFNFYGMVEQVGSVFLEANDGLLYAPNFADVIIRDPYTFKELPIGETGVIQVISLLPRSYPGHSLLTEDMGVIHYIDKGVDGRLGKAFSVLGRVPQAELRGCSDVIAQDAGVKL
jgi:hypothetical protein